ncbi:MAG: AMP-binding protein [Legionellales bacterium]|nr:AMP-binding protein [Legionellales bacterium]
MQQRRALSTHVRSVHPAIGDIYDKLLHQTSKPIPCNFATQIVDHWSRDPDKLAIRCIDQDSAYHEDISYLDIVKRSRQIAHYFASRGLKKGSTVALMLGQRPAWWYSLAGLMRQGIATVPCPRLLTPKDLVYRINDLGINGIITAPELQGHIDAIRKDCPSLVSSVTTGTASTQWDSLTDIFDNNVTELEESLTTTEDPCLYLYTSGTTGQPKAVQHNHDYPFFHWPTGRRWLKATPEDLVYNASDTGWGFTVWITTAAWAMGAKLLITPTNRKFNAQAMLKTLHDQPVSIFCAAPTVLRLLVANKDFDRYRFPHLKRIVTVGEALDETVIKQFESRDIEIAVGFGQAETPLLMGRVDDQPHVSGTMGKPITPYHVAILDEQLEPLAPGNVGQIAVDLIKGSRGGIMRGYANAAEKTKKAFSPDGRYYLTGDWAKLRHDGLFAYQGRKDDLIKSRGYRIGPDEVEKAGMSHPAVAKIAIVGIRTNPDSLNVTVKAFILLKPDYTETPGLIKNIQAHIKQETGPYKYPRLVECLPLEEWEKYETTSGKIRRAGLREREERRLTESATLTDEESLHTFRR